MNPLELFKVSKGGYAMHYAMPAVSCSPLEHLYYTVSGGKCQPLFQKFLC